MCSEFEYNQTPLEPPSFGLAVACFALAACCATLTAARGEDALQFGAYRATIGDLHEPVAVGVGARNEIYVVERAAHRVTVFSPDGDEQFHFGGLGDEAGRFDAPGKIAVAPDGDVIVADNGNCRVQVFDARGRFKVAFGEHGFRDGAFRGPLGVAVDARRIYVADASTARILVFNRRGEFEDAFATSDDAAAKLIRPVAVAANDGVIIAADARAVRMFVFDADGGLRKSFGEWGYFPGMLAEPVDVAIHDGRCYVADHRNHRIQVFDLAGRLQYQWGLHALRPREGEGKLHYPDALAVAPDGSFAVVCESFENRCQVFGLETPAQAAKRFNPLPPGSVGGTSHFGRRVDIDGELMSLVEPDSHSVLIYDITQPQPILIHKFGGQGARPGRFNFPTDVCIERGRNRLTVVDAGNARIQVFRLDRPTGELKYLPGMTRLVKAIDLTSIGGQVASLDAGQSLTATAIDRDAAGNLYILDAVNSLVIALDEELRVVRQFGEYGRRRGQLRDPSDLLVSPDGERIYVVDAGNRRIQVFDSRGAVRDVFAPPPDADGGFARPFSIAAVGDESIDVSDPPADRIWRFRPDGRLVRKWGRTGIGRSEFRLPHGLAVDGAQRLFVVDFGNHRGQVFNRQGEFEFAFGSRVFVAPTMRSSP